MLIHYLLVSSYLSYYELHYNYTDNKSYNYTNMKIF